MPAILFVLAALLCSAPIAATAAPAVAAGFRHALAVSSSGSVFAWGSDSQGQLGQDRLIQRDTPAAVAGLPAMRWLGRGSGHYIGIARDGRVYAWGRNQEGQLGNGTRSDSSVPVAAVGLSGVAAAAGGGSHSLAVTGDGSVWSWGTGGGGIGAAGLPARVAGIADAVGVAAGGDFSLALRRDGSVWAWGANDSGQLGDGTRSIRQTPQPVRGLANIVAITAGFGAAFAVDRDGAVWGWGRNDQAQMADGSGADRLTPARIVGVSGAAGVAYTSASVVALLRDGTLRAWGVVGQRFDGSFVLQAAPVQPGGVPAVASLSASVNRHLALTRDGQAIWVTVEGASPVGLAQLAGATHIVTAPLNGGAVVQADGSVWTWGTNDFGELGDGGVSSLPVPTPVAGLSGVTAVTASYAFSLALKSDGTVQGWGRNSSGELGDGSYTSRARPGRVGQLQDITEIAAGTSHGLALDRGGRLWAWGYNAEGQIGNVTDTYQLTPVLVGGLPVLRAVAGGETHTLALAADGRVWSWGSDASGQLGNGPVGSSRVPAPVGGLDGVIAIAASGHTSLALKSDGTFWLWGDGRGFGHGNLSTPTRIAELPGAQRVVLSAFGLSAFAQKADRTVHAWGANFSGELGDGTRASKPVPVPVGLLANVAAVSAGGGFALALKGDGSLWAWGSNDLGQLGDGTVAGSEVPGLVVGQAADRLLDLDPGAKKDALTQVAPFFVSAQRAGNTLQTALTDLRANGLPGEVYFSALVPPGSPLRPADGSAAAPPGARALSARPAAAASDTASGGTVPVALGRSGFKQTGPATAATSAFEGPLYTGARFGVYADVPGDPLAGSNAIVCMGVTIPELSAKGQVLMRPIASGDGITGVTQCPTVQTPATLRLYRGTASGSISRLTLTATITPQPEDRGQLRQLFMWAVTPDGVQYMHTGNAWEAMREPMVAMQALVVPASGDITVTAARDLDLSRFAGTLVYVGLGSSWTEVRQLNKAGHWYTVQ